MYIQLKKTRAFDYHPMPRMILSSSIIFMIALIDALRILNYLVPCCFDERFTRAWFRGPHLIKIPLTGT